MPLAAEKLNEFLVLENLPARYGHQAEAFFLPFIDVLLPRIKRGELRVLGIHGAQGSGKSTLADFYRFYLNELGFTVAQISLDDFYLTKAERQGLAAEIHPLLKTRGVPGTHDVALGRNIISTLRDLPDGETLSLPRFDKLNDDRYPESAWPQLQGKVDLVIFEGWCVGLAPQPEVALIQAANALEQREDPDGQWRHFVNQQLRERYQDWFAEIDYLLMLRAPSFGCVANWRMEQEQRLALKEPDKPVMSEAALLRFVQHYQRLTEHALQTLAATADCVMTMAEDRQIITMQYLAKDL